MDNGAMLNTLFYKVHKYIMDIASEVFYGSEFVKMQHLDLRCSFVMNYHLNMTFQTLRY